MKKRKKSEIKGAAPWLVTMGDMNNLLMCFFIVMMGDVNVVTPQDFFLTITSFRGSLGLLEGGNSLSKGKLPQLGNNVMSLPSAEKKKKISSMLKKAQELFKIDMKAKYVRIFEDERGLVISLANDVFFEQGSAALKPEAGLVLKKVGSIIMEIPNFVRIEGHTDDSIIKLADKKGGYKTNWELSGARSINVVRYLSEEEAIEPAQLSASAYGQYRPIESNSTPEGKAYNRRVDIVILRDRFYEKSGDKKIPRPLPQEEWR